MTNKSNVERLKSACSREAMWVYFRDASMGAFYEGRLAVRAAMVLWRLAEWVGNFAPTCWDLLAVECGVPTVSLCV
eukprot:780857-Amphidinium_carterae.2